MEELCKLPAVGLCQALRKGEVSSRELTRAYLERIDALEPTLQAFLTLTDGLALQQADEADQALSAWRKDPCRPLPPLTGLPLVIKDLLCQKGVRTTCGSRILENFIPPYSATAVQRLLDAGVVTLGKTNTDEFAMGSSTDNSAYQVTRNPWDLTRVPGGSSGGSAAAVASAMAPLALGTDTGGSVRQPAAFCGVTGLKPTYGRVSRYGLIAYGSSLDSVGVLARSAADAAMLFQHMAGCDPQDATSMDVPVPQYSMQDGRDLRGLRVGVPEQYFIAGMQKEVEQAVRDAISTLQNLGAEIVEITLPHTEFALPVYYLIAPAEASANLARYDGVRFGLRVDDPNMTALTRKSRGAGFGQEVKRRIMLGTYALSAGYYDAYYGQAQKVRTLIKQDFEKAFGQVDVIAAPVTPSTAFKIGEHNEDPLAMYLEDVFTLPANLAGVPGLAFPVGFDEKGLPIGMQLMGRHFEEHTLLQTAHTYQLSTGWHTMWPDI
jgi:aspartyl-tRNA(Asn)/glutamyl-tRNA(Gln) amidotransferase subunit A